MDPDLFFILILTGDFLLLIIFLMGMQACYFKCSWKWFWLMLAGVIISGASLGVIVYQRMAPPPPADQGLPDAFNRRPTTPL